MATPKSQRIGIWIIAIVMTIGTLGSFAVMVLANKNQQIDQAALAKQQAAQQATYQQQAEASAAASQPLDGYAAAAFDASSVTALKKEVIVQGDGPVVAASDTINVSYFGWLPSGKIFDSSKKADKNTPIDLPLTGVITGWTEGLTGEKVGSTVKLTIPADKAYGAQSSGIIPANTPLVFILTINSITKPAAK
ncbi:MAG: FKBP-type peptidyl-prolyl cis-trans isomerase [Candidatus Saccharimonadales bacterium]